MFEQQPTTIDAYVASHGSIILLAPVSAAASEWIGEHVDPEALWFAGALAIEARFAADLIGAMTDWGLALEKGHGR